MDSWMWVSYPSYEGISPRFDPSVRALPMRYIRRHSSNSFDPSRHALVPGRAGEGVAVAGRG